jgi:carboxypeptidase Taq
MKRRLNKIMESNFSLYLDYQKKICAYGFAFAVIGFDAETVAPVNGSENRGKMLGVLGAELFKIISDKKYLKLVENLKKSGKLNF